ncbi:MAG: aldehyde dehydrogenase family protein [Pseudomonadales bacterium]|nr:aldehyde dehydrogenase family protein [Pseudomonadales bacterium]
MAIFEVLENADASKTIRLKSPVDMSAIGEFTVTTPEQVKAAVVKAKKAQIAWAALSYQQRAEHLARLQKVLLDSTDEIMATIAKDSGKADMECIAEVIGACDATQYYAKHAGKMLKDTSKRPHLFFGMKKLVRTYKPKGVVGIITPWNFPFATTIVPTVQALMAGNAVVVKPSEVTPFSGQLLAELVKRAGIPDGIVQVLLGDGSTGAALCEAGVDKIHFTGSVRTGKIVGEVCARQLISATLELGGKDPAIVCADADLDRAVKGVANGALFNTGQVCASTERIYVVEAVYDEFIKGLVAEVKSLRQNSGDADVSCMIWDKQLTMIETQIKDATDKGAQVLAGGQRQQGRDGLFLEPTILVNVDHTMLIMTDETFGPVLPVMKVANEEEAILMANDSPYGLSGSVWTADNKRGLQMAKQLDSGGCGVNEFGGNVYGCHEGSFGGSKESGLGYVNGEIGLKSFCKVQHILIHKFGPKNEGNWFPYEVKTVEDMKKFLKFMFGTAIGRWLS